VTPESAEIPYRRVASYQRILRRADKPVTLNRQKTARHVLDRNALPSGYLVMVLVQPFSQRRVQSLTCINEVAFPVERIDAFDRMPNVTR
jgi:hypothetical protein